MPKKTQDSGEIYDEIMRPMRFFYNKDNVHDTYVEYTDKKGHRIFQSTNSEHFRAYIRNLYRKKSKSSYAPSFSAILQKYIDNAILNQCEVEVSTRLSGTADELVYFLANSNHEVVRVDKTGFEIIDRVDDYHFVKTASMKPQVKPKSGKDLLEVLSPFLNMDDNMKLLFCVNLVQEFLCDASRFLAIISSPQGSGKSTFTKMWKKIVDPSRAVATALPNSDDELKNHLANNFMVNFDNTTKVSNQISNTLCGAITGSTFAKRELYTTHNECLLTLHNIVVLNGIDIIPDQSDLLERSILFRLNKLTGSNRKTEKELEAEFDEALPYILGAVFDTLVKYFQIKDSVQVKGTHRMYGAYLECYIIAEALGKADEFLEAFQSNMKELQTDYISANPIVSVINSYMDALGQKQRKGKVSDIYNEVIKFADKNNFPKAPHAFSRAINAEIDNLKAAGYAVKISENRNCSIISIKRITENVKS